MKKYIVSQDKKTGLYYAHQKGFDHIPMSGSFSKKRTEAMEYAKMYNNLPNKVEEIEQSRKEQFEKEMELTSAEEKWIESFIRRQKPMKRKTYNNVLKGIKIIQKKGYDFQESSEIVLKVFEEHENGEMPIEWWLDKIVNKEEWLKG